MRTSPAPRRAAATRLAVLAVTSSLLAGLSLVMLQSPTTSILGALVALPAAAGFALVRGRVLRARLPLALLTFFAWTVCSVAWSADPRATVRAVTGTGLLLALGVLLAGGRNPTQVARLVLGGAAAVCAVAVGLALVRPEAGLAGGHLRGLTPHENQLGFVAVVGLVTLVVCVVERRISWVTAWGAGALCALTLLWSGSKTGLLVAVVTVASFFVLRVIAGLPPRWQAPLVLLTLLGGSVGVLLGALNRGVVAEALGRDVTLTGRTEIWHVVWLIARERPLAGYGLGAVWRPSSPVGGTVERAVYYFPSHAHNGYLDTFLQVGAVGTTLLVLALLLAVARGSRQLLRGGSGWHVTVTVLLVLYNVSETRFLDHTGWLLLILACTPAAAWKTDQPAPRSAGTTLGPTGGADREEGLRWRYRTT